MNSYQPNTVHPPLLTTRSRKDSYDLPLEGDSTITNPVNQNSRRYTMKQAFGVWYANKENILYDVLQGVHHGENYKLT